MRMQDVDRRKEYVQKIRSSFDHKEHASWEQDADTQGEAEDGFSFFKVRMFFALLLFTIYVVCDQTGVELYQYTTGDIARQIEKSYDYTNLEKYVMMLEN